MTEFMFREYVFIVYKYKYLSTWLHREKQLSFHMCSWTCNKRILVTVCRRYLNDVTFLADRLLATISCWGIFKVTNIWWQIIVQAAVVDRNVNKCINGDQTYTPTAAPSIHGLYPPKTLQERFVQIAPIMMFHRYTQKNWCSGRSSARNRITD